MEIAKVLCSFWLPLLPHRGDYVGENHNLYLFKDLPMQAWWIWPLLKLSSVGSSFCSTCWHSIYFIAVSEANVGLVNPSAFDRNIVPGPTKYSLFLEKLSVMTQWSNRQALAQTFKLQSTRTKARKNLYDVGHGSRPSLLIFWPYPKEFFLIEWLHIKSIILIDFLLCFPYIIEGGRVARTWLIGNGQQLGTGKQIVNKVNVERSNKLYQWRAGQLAFSLFCSICYNSISKVP